MVAAPKPAEVEKKKNPGLGFLGMLIMFVGLIFAVVSGSIGTGMAILAIGAVILVAALASGNVKMLG
jgi:hypothetical protein